MVVCKGDGGASSLSDLRESLSEAKSKGYRLRPSQPTIRVKKHEADELLTINDALAKQCGYDSVQQAVFDAGNNDRILIMPGRYTEPNRAARPRTTRAATRACSRRTPAAT